MKTVNITDVCDIQVGKTPSRNNPLFWGKGALWLSIADMNQGLDLKTTKETITEKAVNETKIKMVPENTVLFSFKLSIGKVGITRGPMYTNEAIAAFIIKDFSKLDTKFLYYVLKGTDHSIGSKRAVMGKTLNKEMLKQFDIPLPSLEEQKRIVRELDAADALRQKRKQAIALLDDYLKAVFLEMFGDPVTNSKGWEIRSLGEMIDFMTSGSRGWARYYADSGDVFLRIQNVERNHLKIDDLCFVTPPDTAESKRTKVRQGDVLLSITADLGRTAVIPENFGNAYISQHLALLRFKTHYLPEYISEFLASQGGAVQMSKLNKGGTKAGLNFNDIKSIQIPIPDINTQQTYIAKKKYIQDVRQFMLSQDGELETNFNALMQKAFSNENI